MFSWQTFRVVIAGETQVWLITSLMAPYLNGCQPLFMSLVTSVFDKSNSMYSVRKVYERRRKRKGAVCVTNTVCGHQSLLSVCAVSRLCSCSARDNGHDWTRRQESSCEIQELRITVSVSTWAQNLIKC